MRKSWLAVAFAALMLIFLPGCSPERAFSTASPDIGVEKGQHMLTGEHANVTLPETVTIEYAGEVPESITIHGDVTMGLFAQRHSADSEHVMDAAIEAVHEIGELLGIDFEANVSP